MKRMMMSTAPSILLSLLAGCGKAKPLPDFSATSPSQQIALPPDGSNISGKYKAEFITLNTPVNGFLTTNAYLIRKDDDFQVSLKLSKGAPGTIHRQAVYTGWRCPVEQDDLNHDGLIDAEEGSKVWGQPLIPLDDDLSTQDEGSDSYPRANAEGDYTYRRTADFGGMLDDLKAEAGPGQQVAKLAPNEGLGLEGNVIIILGADASISLPETVAVAEGEEAHWSFPVACGLIRKLSDEPGELDSRPAGDFGHAGSSTRTDPAPTPPEVSMPPGPSGETDGDSEDWDDRVRRWWRRTWRGSRS